MASNDEKMNAREAARYMGLAHATLAKMRCWGGSPTFMRLGRKIVYARPDLDAWLDARRATSTSDADRLPQRLTDRPSANLQPRFAAQLASTRGFPSSR
jgi:hypothetical protein